jgi:hypothetical protein
MAVNLGRWSETLFAMFSAYFDCSHGGLKDGTFAVSGWLSTAERWHEFSADWQSILASYQVPYFHMKEFAHSRGAYSSGWKGDEPKRGAFIQELIGAISHHAMAGFACLAESQVYQEVDREYRVREHFGSEYALCSRVCVAKVKMWLGGHGLADPVEYVFDDGDVRGRLNQLMEEDGYPPPIYKPSRDRVTKDGTQICGMLPLQAADLAAYELRKGWDDFGDATTIEEVERYRKSFRGVGAALDQGDWGRCSADDLRQICRGRNVPAR